MKVCYEIALSIEHKFDNARFLNKFVFSYVKHIDN